MTTFSGVFGLGATKKGKHKSARFLQAMNPKGYMMLRQRYEEYLRNSQPFMESAEEPGARMLLNPFIHPSAVDNYLLYVYSHLSGDMASADTMLKGPKRKGILFVAHVLFDMVRPFGLKGRRVLYRGVVLNEEYKPGNVLRYSDKYEAFSYTDDPGVACTFSKLRGFGVNGKNSYVVSSVVEPGEVLYHYSYLVKLKKLFTTMYEYHGVLRQWFNPADVSLLLGQREVLVLNSPELTQEVEDREDVCRDVQLYDPEKPDLKGAMRAIKEIQLPIRELPYKLNPKDERMLRDMARDYVKTGLETSYVSHDPISVRD